MDEKLSWLRNVAVDEEAVVVDDVDLNRLHDLAPSLEAVPVVVTRGQDQRASLSLGARAVPSRSHDLDPSLVSHVGNPGQSPALQLQRLRDSQNPSPDHDPGQGHCPSLEMRKADQEVAAILVVIHAVVPNLQETETEKGHLKRMTKH